MITKESSTERRIEVVSSFRRPNGFIFPYSAVVGGSTNRITYDDGPKYTPDNRLQWKRCSHTSHMEPELGPTTLYYQPSSGYWYTFRCPPPGKPSGKMPEVTQDMVDDATRKVVDQFDLNCSDSVLLYSGVLQAVPLVGGCFRFVSIMNKVAKKLSRNLRRAPFTTALKTAISLDFIDRFVVSPTIDDARKFLNAHNYVVNVMNTLAERRESPVALTSTSKTTHKLIERSFSTTPWGGMDNARYEGIDREEAVTEYTLHTLAKLEYGVSAVDPLKLWAARVGITRPLESVWDLVPFSFVVDYFTRAGDFISALSDEMSNQDGLCGRLGKVYGQWYTSKSYNTATRIVQQCSLNYDWGDLFFPGEYRLIVGDNSFSRYPVSFAQLNSGLLKSDNSLIHWDLTRRRAGTLAELLIQAKL